MSVIIRGGSTGTQAEVDAQGNLKVTVAGPSTLPTGASTEAKQDVANTKLDTIASKLDGIKVEVTNDNAVIEGKLDTLHSDLVTVEGKQDTGNASLASIDTKVATAANQASANTKLDTLHADLVTVAGKLDTLDVDINLDTAGIDTRLDTLHADMLVVEGKQNTGNASLASIDTKVATAANQASANTKLDTLHADLLAVEAKQDTGNASLASIDTKVATSANQSSANTKLDTLHTDLIAVEGKQDTGNVSLGSIDTKLTSQATAANQASANTKLDTLHTDLVAVEGKQDTGNSSLASIDTKVATAANQTSANTKLDTLHTDLVAVEAKQDTGNTSLGSIDTKLTSQATASNQVSANTKLDTLHADLLVVEGKLDTLHADLVVVEGKQDTGNTSLASIDTKVATAANQASTITKLTSIDTKLSSQATAANQASELTKLDTIHADLLAVEGKQDTGNTSLGSIDTKLTSQATSAKQDVLATKIDTLHTDLLAVEGKQDTGNTSLGSIDTKLTSQATSAKQDILATKLDSLISTNSTKLDTIHADNLVVEGKLDTINTTNSKLNTSVSGTFTASDAVVAAPIGDGTLVSGASTAGSIIWTTIPDGYTSWTLLIKGYVSGTIYTEASSNTTNGTDGDWIDVKGRRTGTAPGIESTTYADVANGYYRGNGAGFKAFRARLIGGVGPSVLITLSQAMGATFLNSGIPAGSSAIGTVGVTSVTAGGVAVGSRADGYLNVRPDPTTLLFDTFETLDTTNTWTIGGTVIPTGAAGVLAVAPGTAANASSYATSKPAFLNSASSYLQYSSVVQIEAAAVTGNQRFWGLGVITTPTVSVPVNNGVIFELDRATGDLFASVYSNGTRSQVGPLTRPTDGANHRYAIYYRSSRVYFEIDSVTVATLAYPNTQVSALSTVVGSVNGASTVGSAPVLNSTVIALADPGKNASQMSDGKFPWRKATVTATGSLQTTSETRQTYSATSAPGGFLAANNGTDFFTISGSATKTIKVLEIRVGGTAPTSAIINLILLKRSTANTAGTSTTRTPVLFDSLNATATAVVKQYTANPTVGTLVGNIHSFDILFPNPPNSASYGEKEKVLTYGGDAEQKIVLRGTNEMLAFNLNGITVAGNNINVTIIWTEE